MGSIVGMLLLGFLASSEINPALLETFKSNGATVPLSGSFSQFLNQAKAVLFTGIYSAVVTYILLKIINKLVGLRVDPEDEHAGLDVSQHGENAYN
jgi:Amt family ammonium transporter